MSFFHIIFYISLTIELSALGFAIFLWKKLPRDIASLRWIILASPVADIAMGILGLFKIQNLWIGDLFMFVQFTVLLYIFALQFERKTIFKILYAVITVFYLVTNLYYLIRYLINDPVLNKSVFELVGSNAIDGILLITVSIVFLYKLLNELKVVNIQRLPILWIAFATLIYYSGSLFIFLASSYLESDYDSFAVTWTLHNFFNILKIILFATALWQGYRTFKMVNE